MNIVVLAGGLSPERNVSLSSGSLISSALRKRGHRVLMLDVYEGLASLPQDPISLFTNCDTETFSVGNAAPTPEELEEIKNRNGGRCELIGNHVLTMCKLADVTFLALHGDMGENGQLQATLDVFNIKYTGSGYIGSLLAMNKDISKKLLASEGIATPPWIALELDGNYSQSLSKIKELGFPLVVKPCSCGSSVGISTVDNEEELKLALDLAHKYESSVLVEKRIFGREFTQGIVDGTVLPPVEIIPKCGFYDYANKYIPGATEEICPAQISESELEQISTCTRNAFKALSLKSYARIDYILDSNGIFWCLEANTLPGMTPTSLLPQEARAIGIEYDVLCEKLALTALK